MNKLRAVEDSSSRYALQAQAFTRTVSMIWDFVHKIVRLAVSLCPFPSWRKKAAWEVFKRLVLSSCLIGLPRRAPFIIPQMKRFTWRLTINENPFVSPLLPMALHPISLDPIRRSPWNVVYLRILTLA